MLLVNIYQSPELTAANDPVAQAALEPRKLQEHFEVRVRCHLPHTHTHTHTHTSTSLHTRYDEGAPEGAVVAAEEAAVKAGRGSRGDSAGIGPLESRWSLGATLPT